MTLGGAELNYQGVSCLNTGWKLSDFLLFQFPNLITWSNLNNARILLKLIVWWAARIDNRHPVVQRGGGRRFRKRSCGWVTPPAFWLTTDHMPETGRAPSLTGFSIPKTVLCNLFVWIASDIVTTPAQRRIFPRSGLGARTLPAEQASHGIVI